MKTVLLVEDDEAVSTLMERKLSAKGLRVLTASTREQLTEILSQQEIFVSITDLNLPGFTEGEASSIVIERGIPTILLSGSDSVTEYKKENPLILGRIAKHASNSLSTIISMVELFTTLPVGELCYAGPSRSLAAALSEISRIFCIPFTHCSDPYELQKSLENCPHSCLCMLGAELPGITGMDLLQSLPQTIYSKHCIAGISPNAENRAALEKAGAFTSIPANFVTADLMRIFERWNQSR